MAIAKADLEAIETKLVADLKRGVYVGSYTLEGTTYTYRTLTELQTFLEWIKDRIASVDSTNPSGGRFQLARFADI